MVESSGATSPSTSPSTIQADYQDFCEPEPADLRPKGDRTRRSADVWNWSPRARGTDPHVPCRGQGGLDGRLGTSRSSRSRRQLLVWWQWRRTHL